MLEALVMATHEYWQFLNVQERPDDHITTLKLVENSPLSVISSQLPVGTDVFSENSPSTKQAHPDFTVVTGPHNIVRFQSIVSSGFSSNKSFTELPDGFDSYVYYFKALVRKQKEFPRDLQDPSAEVLISSITQNVLSTTLTYVDNFEDDQVGQTWYYTVFYESAAFIYSPTYVQQYNVIYSPLHSHDRAIVLSPNQSTSGLKLYNYFPGRVQRIDQEEQSNLLKGLMDLLGRPLDEISLRTDKYFSDMYSPSEVDAALIPYIDQLLGFPTNFELGEVKRRRETENAVALWKSKGTKNALEGALQQITGWNVELYDGYDHVLRVHDTTEDPLDPNNAPSGWDTATDGVWADLVNALPSNTTVDLSNPVTLDGDIFDNVRVITDFSSWKNPYGVLIRVSSPSATALSQGLMEEKIDRLAEYLMVSYAIPVVKVITS